MKIILVRHGLTQTNKDEVINGQLDESLIKEGKQQAEDAAQRLKERPVDAVYSSPLKRASLTALYIAEAVNKPVEIDHRLIEVDVGKFQGQPQAAAIKEYGCTVSEILDKYDYDFRSAEGGESSRQVEERIRSFLEDLKKMPYQTVVVVSHGGALRWLYYLCSGEKIGRSSNAKEMELTI